MKQAGRAIGFDLVRIAAADPLHEERARYHAWVAEGRQAGMAWITPERVEHSTRLENALPGVRSVIAVGLSYRFMARPPLPPGAGRVARYAWGRDYHKVLGEQLQRLAADLTETFGGEHKSYVDTGPLLDRALAARAGLGWYGKNSNILTEPFGSYVLLGEILTTLDLAPDRPLDRGCGSCRLCVVACPTGALGPDYSLDSRRCISYLTIEHRGPIPRELRPLLADWVFGCDICQDVCPPSAQPYLPDEAARHAWLGGVRAAVRGNLAPIPDATAHRPDHPLHRDPLHTDLDLHWLLHLDHAGYLEAFRDTPIRRAKVWMLRRNAAVALGNVGGGEDVPALDEALGQDEHHLVRGHAAWALGQLAARGAAAATNALHEALEREADATVREEIELALSGCSSSPSEA